MLNKKTKLYVTTKLENEIAKSKFLKIYDLFSSKRISKKIYNLTFYSPGISCPFPYQIW